MANAYKVLGQLNPSASTAGDVYTVPADTEAVISTIVVANIAGTADTYRLSVRPNGTAQENKHYIAYGATVPANDSIALTLGITLDATDVITVYAIGANLTFNVFGSEITA
jgi:hypothetical protein